LDPRRAHLTRRTALTGGAVAALAACAPGGGTASASVSPPDAETEKISSRLRELERKHSARLGVFAHDPATGRTVRHRADERFPICSVFKTLAAAAVLRDLDQDGETLARRIRYGKADLVAHSPVTGTPEHLANGMTVAELCEAAVCYSDNTAANLLLRELGGPTAITRFCRSAGDRTTRLDRWETELNSAEPWRVQDTTSPHAIARTYSRLTLGDELTQPDRRRLTRWLRDNTTSGKSFGAGLPKDWTLADKTGAGSYGTNNDVGIAWPPGRSPVVLAVLTTKREADAEPDYPLVASTATLLAEALTT